MSATEPHMPLDDDAHHPYVMQGIAGRSVRETAQPTYLEAPDAYAPRRRYSTISTSLQAPEKAHFTRAARRTPDAAAWASAVSTTVGQGGRTRSRNNARSTAGFVQSPQGIFGTQGFQEPFEGEEEPTQAALHLPQQENFFGTLKTQLNKARAQRQYKTQFGALETAREQAAAAASNAQPRAALYKTQMGASQRKANRMQQGARVANQAAGQTGGVSLHGVGSALASSRKAIAGGAIALCLLLTCVFIYPTAQQYYQAVRQNDKLQAEYTALVERNQQLQANVQSLQSDSGVEARAHDQLGWVMDGETSARVEGLDVEDDSNAQASELVANIVSSDVKAPDTWYSPVLDVIFGVK